MRIAFALSLMLQGCDSGTGEWTAMSDADAPTIRTNAATVWTGSEVILWGGWIQDERPGCWTGANASRTGGRYDPATDTWKRVPDEGAPGGDGEGDAPHYPLMYWTGTDVLVYTGRGGDSMPPELHLYDPDANAWTTVSPPAGMLEPQAKYQSTWTGEELIMWASGYDSAAYTPSSDTWRAIAPFGARDRVWESASAWSGTEVLIWVPPWWYSGADTWDEDPFGVRYDPATDTWTEMSTVGGPAEELVRDTPAYWSGDEFLVVAADGMQVFHYDPQTDRWSSGEDGPERDPYTETVWMGDRIGFWGEGYGAVAYEPAAREWSLMTREDSPSARTFPAMEWTGDALIVWGGGASDQCDEVEVEGGALWRP